MRYVTGFEGGAGAILNDQMNSAGNQLGSYNLELKKDWTTTSATFYWNHPSLGNGFFWKSLITWSRDFDRFIFTNLNAHDELSFLAEGSYNGTKLPFIVKAGLAGDYGTRFENRLGGYLGIEFNF